MLYPLSYEGGYVTNHPTQRTAAEYCVVPPESDQTTAALLLRYRTDLVTVRWIFTRGSRRAESAGRAVTSN